MMHTTKLGHPSRFISSLSWLFSSRMGIIKHSIWSKEHVIRGIEKMCNSEILLPLERTLDIYEFGVYRGETTVLIEHLLYGYQFTYKNLWGFDAFEGLPQETENDNFHKKGDFKHPDGGIENFERVKNYFSSYENVTIVRGWIPETFKDFTESKLCFVHLDLDLYEGYKYTLDFVWPRLVSGGIIALDDYAAPTCAGAKKATDEFVELHGLTVIDHYYIIKE